MTTSPPPSTDPEPPLFSPTLISPEVSAALPETYLIRPLLRSDYSTGFLDVLRVLTTVGDITPTAWNARYDWMEQRRGEYFVLCVVDTSREKERQIVGTGTVLVERKFIHELGLVGHIEDIAVAKDQQGKKLGLRIIQALDFVAKEVGCYKVSLFLLSVHSLSTREGGGSCVCIGTDFVARLFWIAPRRMRDSMSSVTFGGQGWRWRGIMRCLRSRVATFRSWT